MQEKIKSVFSSNVPSILAIMYANTNPWMAPDNNN